MPVGIRGRVYPVDEELFDRLMICKTMDADEDEAITTTNTTKTTRTNSPEAQEKTIVTCVARFCDLMHDGEGQALCYGRGSWVLPARSPRYRGRFRTTALPCPETGGAGSPLPPPPTCRSAFRRGPADYIYGKRPVAAARAFMERLPSPGAPTAAVGPGAGTWGGMMQRPPLHRSARC